MIILVGKSIKKQSLGNLTVHLHCSCLVHPFQSKSEFINAQYISSNERISSSELEALALDHQ